MSIIKSVQDYLAKYDGMQLINMSEMETDYTPGKRGVKGGTSALAPTGNSRTRTDVLGNKTYENSYIFFAKDLAVDNSAREDMYDFLESLSEWIETKIDEGLLPELPGKYEAVNLVPSNHMLYDIEESGAGVYQVELILTINKRK
ncbi:hypothetical protein [Mogibacterium diversum]|uniref:hypothetical protein n=1 Tax=Mogibacterium diversum TaxID=114527 RepID=UPI0026F1CB81|nr:hypothetical protein [Mogibacterium diversum]